MNTDKKRGTHALFYLCASVSICGSISFAQTPPPTTQPDGGLNALSEDAVLNELAARGLDNLLDYAFTANKVTAEKQAAIRTVIAMRSLGDPSSKLNAQQRSKLLNDVVKGIDGALPTMHDPKLMMRQASDLIAAGVERDVNTLEYWGDNPRTQAQVRPIVQTVIRLLERCVEESRAAADKSANLIRSPDDKVAINRYDQLEQLAREAAYTKSMTDYYLVLAIDKADPQRREIAAKAMEALKEYDTPDQPIRARVRVRMGKLALSANDAPAARAMFDSVITPENADFFKPAPDAGLQYEARYFRNVADLQEQKAGDAQKGLDELKTWQGANLPSPETATSAAARQQAAQTREGANAADAMLQYRILSLKADLASAAGEKKKFTDDAVATLYALLKQQPSLQSIIYDQLMGKLAPDAEMKSLDVLLLQALVRRGEGEVRKTSGTPDTKTLERGLAAAKELLTRGNKIEPQVADSASLLSGFFLDKLKRPEEAAAAFLDYVAKNPKSPNATLALDNVQGLVGQLRKDRGDDPAVVALYEKFLPIAIAPPFNRKQFAYEYARRLQLQSKPQEAIEQFRNVPPDDKRLVAAKFFQAIALQQQLDELKSGDAKRGLLVTEIQTLADEVQKSVPQAMSTATNEADRNNYRSMLVRSTLLAAELARTEQNDPKRALSLLDGFETSVQGLPDAGRRTTDALLVRVQSLMSLNQYDAATAELVKLLDREPARGGRIVYDLLQKLNTELDKAQVNADDNSTRSIARNRAQLTGFLVKWAQSNQNPAVKKMSYAYAVFDAEVQRFAAEHEQDAGTRDAGLKKALERFNALNTPDGVAKYKETIPQVAPPPGEEASKAAAPSYDPAVILGISRTQFDLKNYEPSRDGFSRLLGDRQLGPPISVNEVNGEPREIDNDNYWEAVLKLIRSNLALNNGVDESKNYLKQQLVRWGDRVGGKRFKPDFAKLRTELIPDFDPNASTQPATTNAS